jgi:ketosteroid isomerase-like protein
MITWFTEDSFMPLVTGSLLALAFLGLAIAHYNRAMLIISIGIALATAAIVMVESWIVTDKEAIEKIVRQLGKAVEKNDADTIILAISPKRIDVRERAVAEMERFVINSCRLVDFTDFKLDDSKQPVTAETTFVVFARGSDRYGNSGTAHERVTLVFEKDNAGNWKIIDYSHVYARSGGRL